MRLEPLEPEVHAKPARVDGRDAELVRDRLERRLPQEARRAAAPSIGSPVLRGDEPDRLTRDLRQRFVPGALDATGGEWEAVERGCDPGP